MVDRRSILRSVTLGATLAAAQSVSACSWDPFDDDNWGEKLIGFFRTGSDFRLNNLFRDFTTLVTFDERFGSGPKMYVKGAKDVKAALVSVHRSMSQSTWGKPRKLVDAKIVGSKQEGRMNRIEMLFAQDQDTKTSCGPSRDETKVDLYYQANVYETGKDWVEWSIQRLALMPPLETERFNEPEADTLW